MRILAKGKADFAFPILSPKSGHVFKKNVVEGQEVPEGYPMFEVIDLDTVWVQAQVYEHQLGLIREGQTARATVEAFPGETLFRPASSSCSRISTPPRGRSKFGMPSRIPAIGSGPVCSRRSRSNTPVASTPGRSSHAVAGSGRSRSQHNKRRP